jgi:sterol desaturase/sphingolipid hydroxylase (fatty acid hydroxylase superfamily)
METVDVVGVLVPATFFIMLGVERLRPARHFPARRGWTAIGVAFLLLIGTVSTVLPLLFNPDWLTAHRLLDGTRLGVVGGTVAGWVVLSALAYAWHRSVHQVPLLWRVVHQIHHSAQRVDIPGSTVFHPTEMVAQTLLQMLVTLVILGLDPLAAALVGYVAAFHGMFQHWNVRTPVWLGLLIQRPESHCEHHRLGVHAGNYGDFPLWDLLLGTFKNPVRFEGRCGFEAPADRRLGAMLAFHDVNEPLYGGASRGALAQGGAQ